MEKNPRKRKKSIMHNAMCVVGCCVVLLLCVGSIKGLTLFVSKLAPENNPVTEKKQGEVIPAKAEAKPKTEAKVTPEPRKELYICIDPGHGGKDGGSTYGKRDEKDDCLKIALALQKYMEQNGVKVVMTRADDTYPNLTQRCDIANEAEVDYYVSLHRNKGKGRGVEIWTSSNASTTETTVANNIMEALEDVGIQKNRGILKGTSDNAGEDYIVNKDSDAPSSIIELGFIDNEDDNQLFDDNYEAYAKAIGDGIIAAKDLLLPKTVSVKDETEDKEASAEDVPPVTDDKKEDEQMPVALKNTPIEGIESLDQTIQDWGPGKDTDEFNRPLSTISYQEKYGKYSADFIRTDAGEEKVIYLTIDEGYENGFTDQIINTLVEKNCPAVFFITQFYANANEDLVKKMLDNGFTVGNHSVNHPSDGIPSLGIDKQTTEIMDLHNYMKEKYNYEMNLFRYPAGKFSDQSLALLNNLNYRSVFWSFAYYDYNPEEQPDEAASLEKLKSSLHPGAIYLLHAVSQTNTNIMGAFIDAARAEGYEFKVYVP